MTRKSAHLIWSAEKQEESRQTKRSSCFLGPRHETCSAVADTHAGLKTVPRTLFILTSTKPPCSSLDQTRRKEPEQTLCLFSWSEWRDLPFAFGSARTRRRKRSHRTVFFRTTSLCSLLFKSRLYQEKKRVAPCGTTLFFWSEWRDLNSRPLDPQSSALPTAPHPDIRLSGERFS